MQNIPRKSNAGRKTKYLPEYAEQAYKLSLLGATDAQMADFFGVRESTLYLWKVKHSEFSESLKSGKLNADALIAEKLFTRAKGFKVKEEQAFMHQKTGIIETVKITKNILPDVTAAIFWLKNRQPDKWRDKQVQGFEFENMTDEQLDIIISKLLKSTNG